MHADDAMAVDPDAPGRPVSAPFPSSAIPASSAALTHMSAFAGDSSTGGAELFGEGVPDTGVRGDDELEESEPSLDGVLLRAPLLRAQLVSMLEELDSWTSLMQHSKDSNKAKKKLNINNCTFFCYYFSFDFLVLSS